MLSIKYTFLLQIADDEDTNVMLYAFITYIYFLYFQDNIEELAMDAHKSE